MKKILVIFLVILSFSSCDKNEEDPEPTLEGSWFVKTAVTTFLGTPNINVYGILTTLYPCAKDIEYKFAAGKLTVDDKNCVDDQGETNSFFSTSGATYTFLNNELTITDSGQQFSGTVAFSGNTAVFTTKDPDNPSIPLIITLEKRN